MIELDEMSPVFPNNIVDVLAVRFETDGVLETEPVVANRIPVFRRPLRPTDANQAIGVYPVDWMPDEQSYEMQGADDPGPQEPVLQRYWLNVQTLVKHADEPSGLAIHSVLSTRVRTVLYRDAGLRVGLPLLAVTVDGKTERYRRSGIRTVRFLNNEVQGTFLYVATVEYWLETETT